MMAQRHAGTQTHTTREAQRPEANRFQHRRGGSCGRRPLSARSPGEYVDGRARKEQRRPEDRCARGTVCRPTENTIYRRVWPTIDTRRIHRFQTHPASRPGFLARTDGSGNCHATERQRSAAGPFSPTSGKNRQRPDRGVGSGQRPVGAPDTPARPHQRAPFRALTGRRPVFRSFGPIIHANWPDRFIGRTGAVCGVARCPRLIQTLAPSGPATALVTEPLGNRSQD